MIFLTTCADKISTRQSSRKRKNSWEGGEKEREKMDSFVLVVETLRS